MIGCLFGLLLFAANLAASDELIKVQPNFIKMRHAADVFVELSNSDKIQQISLQPGGPFVSARFPLPTVAKQIVSIHGMVFLLSEEPVLYQFAQELNKQFEMVNTFALDAMPLSIDVNDKFLMIAYNNSRVDVFELGSFDRLALKSNKIFSDKVTKAVFVKDKICVLHEASKLTMWDEGSASVQEFAIPKNIQNPVDFCLLEARSGQRNLQNKKSYQDFVIEYPVIAVANGDAGLSIFNLDDNGLSWIGSYNKLGFVNEITKSNDRILVVDDKGTLSYFDVSNLQSPLLKSDFALNENVIDISLDGQSAYAITETELLYIDFKSQSPPSISTLGVNEGGSRRSTIKGNILYVADWFSGFHIYDITLPHAPRLMANYHTPGSSKGVLVKDDVAFVADDDHGLQIINVSDPRNPFFVSELPLAGLAYTMKLRDNLLYVASHSGGFHIIDVDNVSQPTLVSSFDTAGKSWALALKNDLLYVADDDSGVLLFDVKNPKVPKLVNRFNPGGFAEDIVIIDDIAYVAFFDLGLYILDIKSNQLKEIAHLAVPGNARGIDIQDDHLFMASWKSGVHVINIQDKTNPYIVNQYDTKGAAWGLSVKAEYIYVMDWWGGVKVIDAANLANLNLAGQYQTEGKIQDILYRDGFIYTAKGSRGLQIYEATNSLNPVWAAGVDFDGYAKYLAIGDKQILVAAGDGGLVMINVDNPFQPKWVSQHKFSLSVDMVEFAPPYALLAKQDGNGWIVDLSDAKSPKKISRINESINKMQRFGSDWLILTNKKQLKVVAVNKLSTSKQSEITEFNHSINDFVSVKDSLFVADENQLIHVYKFNQQKLEKTSQTLAAENISYLHFAKQSLFAISDSGKLYEYRLAAGDVLSLMAVYSTTHEIRRITSSNSGFFFSGESAISSAKMLPELSIKKSQSGYLLGLPNNMPLGSYDLFLQYADGVNRKYQNILKIGFPKLKSKFTLEDLKRKMLQKNFSGKAPVAE